MGDQGNIYVAFYKTIWGSQISHAASKCVMDSKLGVLQIRHNKLLVSSDRCLWLLGLERIHQVTNTIRIANTGWRICIREYTFFSEATRRGLGNGLSVLVYACTMGRCTPLRSCKPSLHLGKPKNFQTIALYLAGGSPISTTFLSMIANIPVPN